MKFFSRRQQQQLSHVIGAFEKSLKENSLENFIANELYNEDSLATNLRQIFAHVKLVKGLQRAGFAKLIVLGMNQQSPNWASAFTQLASSNDSVHLLAYVWPYCDNAQRQQILVQCATSVDVSAYYSAFLQAQVSSNSKYYEDATLVKALLKEPDYLKKFNRPSSGWARNVKRSDLRQYLSSESLRVVLEHCSTVDDLKAIIRPNTKYLRGLLTFRDSACQKLTEEDWSQLLQGTTDDNKRAYLLTCLESQNKKWHKTLSNVRPAPVEVLPAGASADTNVFVEQNDQAAAVSGIASTISIDTREYSSDSETASTVDDELSYVKAVTGEQIHASPIAADNFTLRMSTSNSEETEESECATEATEVSDDEAEPVAAEPTEPVTPKAKSTIPQAASYRIFQELVGQASPAFSAATPKTVSVELSPEGKISLPGSPAPQLDEDDLDNDQIVEDGYETDETPSSIDTDDYLDHYQVSIDAREEKDDDELSCSTATTASCELSM